MTSDDELLKRLETDHCKDGYGCNALDVCACVRLDEAAARIRELEAALDEADRQAKKLEALVEKVVAWEGKEPTHVIVPVEPTPEMIEAGWDAHDGELMDEIDVADFYRDMIRASQESKQ